MKEWLLSGHNTQESVTVARPLTATGVEKQINASVGWVFNQILDGIMEFDQSLPASVVVQGWLYLNIDYSVHNSAFPFDPASVGVPPEVVLNHPEYIVKSSKVPNSRLPLVYLRFRKAYRWAVDFYEHELASLHEEFKALYGKMRRDPDDDVLLWEMLKPSMAESLTSAGRAHEVVSITLVVIDSILRQQAPELLGLLTGTDTTTSQLGQRVWDLRCVAKDCGEEVVALLKSGVVDPAVYAAMPAAAPLVAGLDDFLEAYGHRGFRYEFDMTADRIIDRPDQILLAVAGQLELADAPSLRAQAARVAAEALLEKLPLVKRFIWRRVLRWAQRLIAWREDTKSFLTLQQSVSGCVVRALARRFYADAPEDMLLFYTFDEFTEFMLTQGRASVPRDVLERRRADFELHFSQTAPPQVLWYNPETHLWRPAVEVLDVAAEVLSRGSLEGIPVSAGIGPVEGIALVTNDPNEAGRQLLILDEPVILVTRLTDPAWSSLFAGLTGVVTELGGVISHAAIVARENGLPAIVGVPDVTHMIRDGQRLRIDGKSGFIDILG